MTSNSNLWRVFCYLHWDEELEDACPCSKPLDLSEAEDLLFDLYDINELEYEHRAPTFFLKADGIHEYDFLDKEEEIRLFAIDFDPVREGMANNVYPDGIEDCYELLESDGFDLESIDEESRTEKQHRVMALLADTRPALYASMYLLYA